LTHLLLDTGIFDNTNEIHNWLNEQYTRKQSSSISSSNEIKELTTLEKYVIALCADLNISHESKKLNPIIELSNHNNNNMSSHINDYNMQYGSVPITKRVSVNTNYNGNEYVSLISSKAIDETTSLMADNNMDNTRL
jgi:hypothetical protein